jgi:hypothetical protein
MNPFHKLSIEQLESFIEKNEKYENLMPEMLEDARYTLLHKKIEEFVGQTKTEVKNKAYKW